MENDKKEVRTVAHGKVHEKSLGEKAMDIMLSEDTRTVRDYFFWDILVPGIKNGIYDFIGMALFGSRRGGHGRSERGRGYVSYRDYYDDDRRERSSGRVARSDRTSDYDFSDIEFETRGEVEEILQEMERLIKKYDEATVADLCRVIGMTGRFTDNNYGWRDCRDFSYRRSGRFYVLDFARPEYLN